MTFAFLLCFGVGQTLAGFAFPSKSREAAITLFQSQNIDIVSLIIVLTMTSPCSVSEHRYCKSYYCFHYGITMFQSQNIDIVSLIIVLTMTSPCSVSEHRYCKSYYCFHYGITMFQSQNIDIVSLIIVFTMTSPCSSLRT